MKITSLKVVTNGEKAYSVMARYELDNGERGHVQSKEWIATPFPAVPPSADYREKTRAAALDLAPDLSIMAGVSFSEAEDAVSDYLATNPNWGGH